jgi:multidrug efflux pump subunit AcrA (membrane-fusion protein)
MVDVNNLYLDCHLPADLRSRIREGETVTIHVDSPVPADATGKVDICSPVINPASGDFKVRILIPNSDGRLTPGVQAKGTIESATIPATVAQ